MELNKKTTIRIVLILFATVAFCIGLINIKSVWAVIQKGFGILSPIILGLCIAFLLYPLAASLEAKFFGRLLRRFPKRGRTASRGLAVFTSIVIVLGVIALLILLVVPEIQDAFTIMGETLPDAVMNLITNINGLLQRFNLSYRIPTGGVTNWTSLLENALTYIKNAFENGALGDLANTALTIVSWIANILLGLIFSIYVLLQREQIAAFFSKLIRAFSSEKNSARIFKVFHLVNSSFRNFVTGQLTEAVILGMLCFFGMLIFGFPYPAAISAVIGVMALIPIFGAWTGAIVGALLCLSESLTEALLFLLFLIILQQIDGDFIYPKVVGRSVGLPGLLVFVSVIIGAGLGGILGILLAIPLCSILYVLIKESIDKRLSGKASLNEHD